MFVRTVHSSRDGSCPDVLREQGGAARRGGKKRTLEFKRVRLNGYGHRFSHVTPFPRLTVYNAAPSWVV